jgi:uncharacterized protein (TIGR02588 family)
MAPRKKPDPPGLLERTPIAEWVAAALGLLLTLGVIGYLVWDGLRERDAPPDLSVIAGAPAQVGQGFVVPVTVRNDSPATAADVEVLGVLEQGGVVIEERRASFAYVPGDGEATGGLVFSRDPRAYRLRLEAEGYADP